jgi:FKBP-type peptidyl-prolyl cis-trans isomerase
MTMTPRRFALTALLAAVGAGAVAIAQTTAPSTAAGSAKVVTPSGLTIIEQGMIDTVVQQGDTVTCHYTGRLADGTVFDSSKTRNEPFTFRLGIDGVIKGWAEGVTGMRVGQKRQLIIPPELGYGANGAPPSIPGGATLTFDIEVLYISRPAVAK